MLGTQKRGGPKPACSQSIADDFYLMPTCAISRSTSSCATSYSGRTSSSSSRSRKYSAATKLASRSVKSRPAFSRNFTNAVCASPTTCAAPSTKNFVSIVSACRVAMPFHICEKRHWYVCPVSLEVTSKAPMNWLIAPVLASTGRVVTQSPLEQFSVVSNRFSVRKRILERDSHSLLLLSTHSGSGFHLRVAPNRRSHAGATRHAETLIE